MADVCASPMPLVIACGGGTVVDPDNRRALRAAGIGRLVARAGEHARSRASATGATRPLLQGDPEGALERLGRLRELTYEAAAHASVDTDDLDVDGVADAVLSVFEGAPA